MKARIVPVLLAILALSGAVAIGILIAPIIFPAPIVPTARGEQIVLAAATSAPPPTAVSYPTYAYRPTFTPIPTATAFVISLNYSQPATPVASSFGGTGGTSQGPSSTCTYQLNTSASYHERRLSSIKSIYSPLINYYKSVIEQALRMRDALMLAQAQRDLKVVQAQYQADVRAENQRYQAEVQTIKSNYC